jgi:hypothetical protein
MAEGNSYLQGQTAMGGSLLRKVAILQGNSKPAHHFHRKFEVATPKGWLLFYDTFSKSRSIPII